MSKDGYMPLNDFKNSGLLQEVNRQFFNPRGLALAVEIDSESDEVLSIVGLRMCDDPEGYELSLPDDAVLKAQTVKAMLEKYKERRVALYGTEIQPIPGV